MLSSTTARLPAGAAEGVGVDLPCDPGGFIPSCDPTPPTLQLQRLREQKTHTHTHSHLLHVSERGKRAETHTHAHTIKVGVFGGQRRGGLEAE